MDSFAAETRVSVDERGLVRGTLRPAPDGSVPQAVRLAYDDRYLATVPVTQAHEAGQVAYEFSCGLPPVADPGVASVEIYDPAGQVLLHRLENVARTPLYNGFGLSAHDVLSTATTPMFGVPWFSFDGAVLTISGAHLPPGGDPSRLSVRLAKGVRYDFAYPLHGGAFASHFWYWPNAHHSGFILTIDLAASDPGSDPFFFDFMYQGMRPARARRETISVTNPLLRQRIWIPRNFRDFVGHPRDATQLTRVQTYSNAQSVTFTGYNVFKLLESALEVYGVTPRADVSILDWGCGHGRVTRHFINGWPEARICGADIDAENVAWCQDNLPRGHFTTVPLMPPSGLEAESFDAVFGISVVTHLTEAAQIAWLQELSRILKPGGLALLSFGGASGAAWGSLWHNPGWWEKWRATGFDDGIIDPALDGKIPGENYYRVTAQSIEWTRKLWSRYFQIVAIEADFVGNQDLAVLRRI
jgi:SAM-dependent methyltransferase